MMLSRAASLRRPLAAAAPILRSSRLSTTAKPAPKKAAATRDPPLPPHLDPAEVKIDPSQFWIPVIFQGDLAQIASCHLKENYLVNIMGHITGDEPTAKVEDAHRKIRIYARSLCFLESNSRKDDKMASEQGTWVLTTRSTVTSKWRHCRPKAKERLNVVTVDRGTWVLTTRSTVTRKWRHCRPKAKERLNVVTVDREEELWKDVFENRTKWSDNRLNKRNPRSPDFKHKDSGDALWLNSSPSSVLGKLPRTKRTTEDLWKDVIENPTKWWDTRLNKPNPRYPDFKHKDSGDALWLNTSPSWVPEKLPPAESTTNTDSRAKATILS